MKNGYAKIMLISTVLIIFSLINDYYNPLFPLKKDYLCNIKRLFWRWMHWNIAIFISFFCLFFDITKFNNNIAIYYSLLIITVSLWYSNMCIINLLEIKNYNVNIFDVKTSVRPHIESIFNKSDIIISLLYIGGFFNIIYMTFFTKKFNNKLKYIVFAFLLFSLFKTVILNESNILYSNNLLTKCLMANPYI